MNIKKVHVNPTWWTTNGGFFGKYYLEADHSFEGFLNTPKVMGQRICEEVGGVVRLCKLKKGNFVLDAPCGYGRHSIGLAQNGLRITGVDINDFFLDFARKRAKELRLKNCNFIKRDIRKLTFKNQFDAVINMFYSFGFFDDEDDDFSVIKNFYKSLKIGGKFLMHTFITLPKIEAGDYKRHEIRTLSSGNKLELYRDYDFQTKREYGKWYIVRKSGHKEKLAPYSMRVYTDIEFIGLCVKAGFRKFDVYGSWEGAKYKDTSELMVVVATK